MIDIEDITKDEEYGYYYEMVSTRTVLIEKVIKIQVIKKSSFNTNLWYDNRVDETFLARRGQKSDMSSYSPHIGRLMENYEFFITLNKNPFTGVIFKKDVIILRG